MDIESIIKYLDNYLTRTGRPNISPVEANDILSRTGLLSDSKDRPGKPIRELYRAGKLPHAFQSGGKGSSWTIPHSSKLTAGTLTHSTSIRPVKTINEIKSKTKFSTTVSISALKAQLEKARQKYKPEKVKYLLVAEAPPDSVERFFYYDNVRQHDYLFLGISQALYPDLKQKFLASGRNSQIKNSILLKFQADGFYLLDLSELPLSLMTGDLNSQLPALVEKIKMVANKETQIILIKATVYDTAFYYLQQNGFKNVVNIRIPFPGQGGQKRFQIQFNKSLELRNHVL